MQGFKMNIDQTNGKLLTTNKPLRVSPFMPWPFRWVAFSPVVRPQAATTLSWAFLICLASSTQIQNCSDFWLARKASIQTSTWKSLPISWTSTETKADLTWFVSRIFLTSFWTLLLLKFLCLKHSDLIYFLGVLQIDRRKSILNLKDFLQTIIVQE